MGGGSGWWEALGGGRMRALLVDKKRIRYRYRRKYITKIFQGIFSNLAKEFFLLEKGI